MKQIAIAGNTVVPGLLALERLGFEIAVDPSGPVRATRGDESYIADDPVTVLGLVKLVEMRSWNWRADDSEITEVISRYKLG